MNKVPLWLAAIWALGDTTTALPLTFGISGASMRFGTLSRWNSSVPVFFASSNEPCAQHGPDSNATLNMIAIVFIIHPCNVQIELML